MNNRQLRALIVSVVIPVLLMPVAIAGVGEAKVTDAKGEVSELKNSEVKLTFTAGESVFVVDAATVSSVKVSPDGRAQLTLRGGKSYTGTVSGSIVGEAELGRYTLDAGKLRELVLAPAAQPGGIPSTANPRATSVTDAKGTVTSVDNAKLTGFTVLRGKTRYDVDISLTKAITCDGGQCTVEFTVDEKPLVGVVSSGQLTGQSDLGNFTIAVAKTKSIVFPVSTQKPAPVPERRSGVTLQVTDSAGKSSLLTGVTWQWERYVSHCNYMIHTFCNCGGHTEQDDRLYLPLVLPGGCARIMFDKILSLEVKEQAKDKVVVVVALVGGGSISGVIGSLPNAYRGRLVGATPTATVQIDPQDIAGITSVKSSGTGSSTPGANGKTSAYQMAFTMKDGLAFDVTSACVADWGQKSVQGVPLVGNTALDVTVGESKFNVSFDKIAELNGFTGKPMEVELVTTTGSKKTGTLADYQWLGGWTPWGDVWARLEGLSSVKIQHNRTTGTERLK